MEETHYSTNEELQATLQELADLQAQLSELQSDNDRLVEEKDVLFQSLCRQTEKLEDSRNKIVKLQELLLRDSDQQDSAATTEREQKLLDLLKNTQEERETMFMKQEELQTDMKELRASLDQATAEKMRSIERINTLETTVDASAAERKQLEAELMKLRETANARQIDISRLSALLENARSKIDEFEQERAMGNKTDLHDLLDTTRKEKDALEGTIAVLQESLSKSQCEVEKLKDQIAAANEECKVTRNNAKCALSDLQYKFEQMKEEKIKLSLDLKMAQDSIGDLEAQCGRHVEEKVQLEGRLAETKRHLSEKEQLLGEREDALNNERKLRKFENEEWKQFQSDLLMTVRVANDFKTEAQMAHEQLVIDNKMQRDRIRALEQENMRLTKSKCTDPLTCPSFSLNATSSRSRGHPGLADVPPQLRRPAGDGSAAAARGNLATGLAAVSQEPHRKHREVVAREVERPEQLAVQLVVQHKQSDVRSDDADASQPDRRVVG